MKQIDSGVIMDHGVQKGNVGSVQNPNPIVFNSSKN